MKMLIAGKWVDTKEKMDVMNPYDGSVVDTVPCASVEDARRALESAKGYIDELTAYEKYRLLYDVAEMIKAREKEFAEILTREAGKPIGESLIEMKRSYQTFLFSAEEAKRINGEAIPVDAIPGMQRRLGVTILEPVGLVLAISPFNYPLNLVAHKVGPAIAAGNSVVLKPSSQTPLTALKMGEVFMECGMPSDMMSIITGKSSVIADVLVESPLVDKITFTGSVPIGERICQSVGMIKCSMELGGNDPLIVLSDCDVDKAVKVAAVGAYGNNGQRCTSIKRLIVEEGVADDFVKKFVEESKVWKCGDPMSEKTLLGPLINEKSAKEVEVAVNDAVSKGAKLLLGGKRDNAFYQATVLDHVKQEMDLVKFETFGPVAPVIRVKDFEEAIRVANSTEYGLQAGIMTQDIDKAMAAARRINAGAVIINDGPGFRAEHLPFGGVKKSGMGREGVKYAIREMMKIKTVVL